MGQSGSLPVQQVAGGHKQVNIGVGFQIGYLIIATHPLIDEGRVWIVGAEIIHHLVERFKIFKVPQYVELDFFFGVQAGLEVLLFGTAACGAAGSCQQQRGNQSRCHTLCNVFHCSILRLMVFT